MATNDERFVSRAFSPPSRLRAQPAVDFSYDIMDSLQQGGAAADEGEGGRRLRQSPKDVVSTAHSRHCEGRAQQRESPGRIAVIHKDPRDRG